jgi:death on curing protein
VTEVTEPKWLSLGQVLWIHDDALSRHGGLPGVRDEGLLDSAIARPQHAFAYGERDLFVLAALYAEGIMTHNHPFTDGNKRTGYNTAAMFLLSNGYELQVADDPEQRVALFEQVAAGTVATNDLAQFYRDKTRKRLPM